MNRVLEIKIPPALLYDELVIRKKIGRRLGIKADYVGAYRIVRRSIDARKAPVLFVLRIELSGTADGDESRSENVIKRNASPVQVNENRRVIIVGAGPAGYFAALRCIERGVKPIVIDRGKDVRARRRDLRQIQQFHQVNPDSNYCFGEGGAGTYSDGKLYTRSIKRGNVKKVLTILTNHGANADILVDAHPHIGSNKLPNIVSEIRHTIERAGGEVYFDQRVVDFSISNNRISGVSTKDRSYSGDAVILATGHSARDIYALCSSYGISLSFKPFAIGVRIEHPQALIDEIQYHQKKRHENLPAASYRLACQVKGKGVFSFCMCPGGLIVPTATAPGELVVNGMSLSKRDSPFANSGTVVSIDTNPEPGNVLGGLNLQRSLEQYVFSRGTGTQAAPAQRLTDFVNGRLSSELLPSSYIPGIYPANFRDLLPEWMTEALREAVIRFDKKMKGYYTDEAQLIGLESRTSSPVRIDRNEKTLMSDQVAGLFPCGEGAGYAGGILSAALDGERVADQVIDYLYI